MNKFIVGSAIFVGALAFARMACAAAPLVCPAGTRLDHGTDSKQRLGEYCVDEKTGRRRGPQREFWPDGTISAEGTNDPVTQRSTARIFDQHGVLTDEIALEKGKIVERRMTLAGMRMFVAGLSARESSAKVTYRAIDERNVGVDFHFPDADPRKNPEKLEGFRTYVRASFCKMLTGPEQIDSVLIRVLNDRDAEPAMITVLKREDCKPAS